MGQNISVNIFLDNTIITAGQKLSGVVIARPDKDITGVEMKLQVLGRLVTKITRPDEGSSYKKICLVRNTAQLINGCITSGEICRRFKVEIPANVPPSGEHCDGLHYADIRYKVQTLIQVKGGPIHKQKAEFQVVPTLNYTPPPSTLELDYLPLKRWFFAKLAPAEVSASLLKSFVRPGEEIAVYYQFENYSQTKFKRIRVALRRETTVRTDMDEVVETKKFSEMVYTGLKQTTERQFFVKVPDRLKLYTVDTHNFSCKYFVQIELIGAFCQHTILNLPVHVTHCCIEARQK
eukprot:TRINITY_DN71533_c0_g1_i1.p1 TRINITY_DN71533_c0_g1~~TRINITY_DN71533_c0_g1_i1.p1  ORF type:complete len:292 (-),score=25.41 TRINITY_DN71533_c0_g1_i1:67-942(-)